MEAATCDSLPEPPDGSHWEQVAHLTDKVYEYQKVYYQCESGYGLVMPAGQKWPKDHDGAKQKLECRGNGLIKDEGGMPWHTQTWPPCNPLPTRRKRELVQEMEEEVEKEEEEEEEDAVGSHFFRGVR